MSDETASEFVEPASEKECESGEQPKVNPEFLLDNIRGSKNAYATYAAKLDLATQMGLKSIEVKILQFPTAENQHTAVCEAQVMMSEGRFFIDIGDASPTSTSANLIPAIIRLASTRAKGRALGDAVNIADAVLDEVGSHPQPGNRPQPQQQPYQQPHQQREQVPHTPPRVPQPRVEGGAGPKCSYQGCTKFLTGLQAETSTKRWNKLLCPEHSARMEQQQTHQNN